MSESADGQALGTLHYFFDALLPFLEVFYRKQIDFSAVPSMKQTTDDLAKALIVRGEGMIRGGGGAGPAGDVGEISQKWVR